MNASSIFSISIEAFGALIFGIIMRSLFAKWDRLHNEMAVFSNEINLIKYKLNEISSKVDAITEIKTK